MPDTYKVLAQAVPTTTAPTDLYTVPASTAAIISKLMVAYNSTTSSTSFSVSVAVAGTTDTTKQYVAVNVPIGVGDSLSLLEGATLGPADVVRVKLPTTTGLVIFNLFGVEKS